MASMVAAFVEWILATYRPGGRMTFINNGDDCVLFMERRDLRLVQEHISRWFTDLGFNIEVEEPVDEFEQVVFCQTQPVKVTDGWIMVRDPRVVLTKDILSTKKLTTEDEWRTMLSSVGECGYQMTADIPILSAAYRSMIRAGNGKQIAEVDDRFGFRMMARGVKRSPGITAETRASVWAAFGITPDHQIAMEKAYDDSERMWCAPTTTPDIPMFQFALV
jgi:hypothetical protein